MTEEEVESKIKAEIGGNWDISNAHGVDLRNCLIKPIKQKYIDSMDKNRIIELWTVLEETPDRNGYKIYYDETADDFGLGMRSDKDELISLGIYGTFLETLENM
jgi:hypothetical protein